MGVLPPLETPLHDGGRQRGPRVVWALVVNA